MLLQIFTMVLMMLTMMGMVYGMEIAKPGHHSVSNKNSKIPKFLNLITWVKFDNTECAATSGDNGTCFTSNECSEIGGVADGTCATGFGVCCVLQVCFLDYYMDLLLSPQYNCGSKTNYNSTYFLNNNYPSTFNTIGQCSISVEKVNTDVCQLRLDFDEMDLSQPDPTTHQCTSDRFVVTGGAPVPIICGRNTGEHMYIDAGSGNSPTSLTFITTGSFERAFKMKISQIECGAVNRGVEGCLQYHTGVSGTIRSFNYMDAEGLQLSNQEYSVCVRHERGFCGISYTACPDPLHTISESFTISKPASAGEVMVGDTTCTTDWISIPCATTSTAGSAMQASGSTPGTQDSRPLLSLLCFSGTCVERICGEVFCSVTNHPTPSMHCPIYSFVRPFAVRVHLDKDEQDEGTPANNRGFCLEYVQQPCTSY